MRTLDSQIAEAVRLSVQRVLPPLQETARAVCRIDRRMPDIRRSGRGAGGTRDDAIDFNLYGLQNFSAANYLQTANPGGEAGTASGFGGFVLVRLNALGAAIQLITERLVGAAGYTLYLTAGNLLTVEIKSGGGVSSSANYQFVASDVGRLIAIAFQHTGSAVRLLVSRVQSSSGDVAITGYTAASGVTSTGIRSGGTFPFTSGTLLSETTFTGTPSVAQLQAYYDAARVLGDLPDTMQGATVTHLWSVKRELAGTTVVNGQTAPAQLTDRVTAAAGDALVRATTGIAVQNDANSIRGIGPYTTTADYYQTAVGGGIQGGSAFWVQIDIWLLAITASAQDPAGCAPSGLTTGWCLRLSGGGQMFGIMGAASQVLTSLYTLTSGDLNKRTRVVLNKTAAGAWQLWVNGTQVGADITGTAFTANAANAVAMTIGQLSGVRNFTNGYVESIQGGSGASLTTGEIAALNADLTTAAPVVAGKTQKRHIFEQDIAAAPSFGVPASSVERISGGDSLYRVGGPITARVIDPTIDGRRTLGAQGFSASNNLVGVVGQGVIGSATGWWVAVPIRQNALTAAAEIIACHTTAGAAGGWCLQTLSSTIRFAFNGVAYGPNFTPAAADLLVTRLYLINYTGTALRVYYGSAVQIGADSVVGYNPAPTGQQCIGAQPGGLNPSPSFQTFGLVGGNLAGGLTFAQVQQAFTEFDATGLTPTMAGLAQHRYDLTTDILASGVDAVPATVLDRVGTDNLTRVGPDYSISGFAGLRLYGTANPPINGLQTAVGGGIQGGATLTVSMLWVPISAASQTMVLASRYSGSQGWNFTLTGTGTLNAFMQTATSGGVASASYTLAGGDYGTLMHLAMVWSGSTLVLYVNGAAIGAPVSCLGTFTPPTTIPMLVGAQSSGFPIINNAAAFAIAGGTYAATAGEIATQSTASRAAGQLAAISGKTDDRRYNYAQDAIDQATALPAKCIDRMGSADVLMRLGSPLVLAQRTERVWSYEASPILYGVDAFTDSDHYASVAGQGFIGGTAGWWFALPFVLETQGVSSGTRIVAGNEVSGSFGFDIRTTGTNSLISAIAYNSTPGQVSTPSISLASSDVGKQLLFFVVFDGAKVHSYMRRVEAGTGTACTGYSVPDATSVMRIGKHPNLNTFSATGISALGGMGGLSIPTLAEIQAAHDAFLASDDLIAIPGKTDFFVSVKQDARANGGVLPSTLVDRIGGKNLSKTGSPALVPMYARAAGW